MNLASFDVVVFLLTTGDVLDSAQQTAFERFIQAGGGYVGIHSATDTEYGWPWYEGLVGAYFNGHPKIQTAEINRSNQSHPSTDFLPIPWVLEDEWYNFKTNPSENNNITVLLWLDESTYAGGKMGNQHPISWSQFYDGGRSWYTGIGHRSEHYTSTTETLFQQHVIAGIEWAADKNNVPVDPNALNEKIYLPLAISQ
jgi:type 1 glutamine amidotransferase